MDNLGQLSHRLRSELCISDHFPVTDVGRLIATAPMISGIAVLGVVTASPASWLVESVASETAAEVEVADESVRRERRRVDSALVALPAEQ